MDAKHKYNRAVRKLRNEKQRQRNRLIRANLKRYRDEQPVIDVERQLAGKLVDTKVMETLEHKSFMPPEHLIMVDAILSMPGATIEAEYQRRINAINAMAEFCRMEEGRPTPRPTQSRRRPVPDGDDPCPPAKRQRRNCHSKYNFLCLIVSFPIYSVPSLSLDCTRLQAQQNVHIPTNKELGQTWGGRNPHKTSPHFPACCRHKV